jgi:hypothetical protein
MKNKVAKILEIWHKHFEDETNQYSEFEDSDIEYFTACLLYNHFKFIKALDTIKTIDLSYDFLSSCGDEYDDILEIIKSINLETESQKIEFLQEFIQDCKLKYSEDELYLLNRIEFHLKGIAQRYKNDEKPTSVEFIKPKTKTKSANPLLR